MVPHSFHKLASTPYWLLFDLILTTMKTCKVFWSGASKSGNHYVGVEYFEGDFAVKRFVKVTGTVEYTVDQEVQIPDAALS